MNIVVCLKWWGAELVTKGQPTEGWLDAVRDVMWVLEKMTGTGPALASDTSPPAAPTPPPAAPPPPPPLPESPPSPRNTGAAGTASDPSATPASPTKSAMPTPMLPPQALSREERAKRCSALNAAQAAGSPNNMGDMLGLTTGSTPAGTAEMQGVSGATLGTESDNVGLGGDV
ncbi:hypothetical protein C8J57DRAFT_1526639 [Mycena rebaudengoi]|nr:hypothetical protein C8J57DRAFT_1526639 [Mycena rebaudengoi]